jgi:hypothetical protein
MSFVHLHVRSHWSPIGVSSTSALARQARHVGQTALALTDRATVSGLDYFIQACDGEGIRPILGGEVPHQPHFPSIFPQGRPVPILPVLVSREAGWISLVSLLNRAWFDYRRSEPAVRFNGLAGGFEGLFVMTGMPGTELHSLLSDGLLDEAEVHLRWLQNAIGQGNLLVALEDHGHPDEQTLWRRLFVMAKEAGLRTVATYGVTHACPEDGLAAAFLEGKPAPELVDFRDIRRGTSACIAPGEEIHARFSNRLSVIESTLTVAESCDWRPALRNRVPCPPLPRGLDPLSALVERAFEGLLRRKGWEQVPAEARNRLKAEIDDARSAGMVEPLLLLSDILSFCESHHIPTGLGSGRLVSSLLAYALGISRIDPLAQSLVYVPWPANSGHGPVLPLEVPWRHANRISAHLQARYGEDFHGFVADWEPVPIGHLARQIRSWAFGNPEDSVRDLMYYSHYHSPDHGGFESVIAEHSVLRSNTPEVCAFVLDCLHPRPGEMGVAAGVLAVSSESLASLCPTVPTRRGKVTQFPERTLSRLGLAILRIEPNPALDIVDEVTRWVRENGHPDFFLDAIPLDDGDTFATLAMARTAANPPLSSTKARMILGRQSPSHLSELRRALIEIHGSAGSDYPVHQSVADTMIAYRLAFLATHFPAVFYAAALTAACGHSHRFHAIAAEARSRDLPLIPPDITCSQYSFSATRQGILSGLVAVKGMTGEAWQEISRLRDGNLITGLREFANRVGDAVTPDLIHNLVHAGCFDAFARSRAQLCIELDNIFRELHETITPSPDRLAEFSREDLLKRELEAADHFVGLDSSQLHRDLWRACHAISPEDISRRHIGKRVAVFGRITCLEDAGTFFGFSDVVIADMEGLLIAVPRDDIQRYEVCLFSELPVLLVGILEKTAFGHIVTGPSFHHPDELRWAESVVDSISMTFPSPPNFTQATRLLKLARKFSGGRTWLSIPTNQLSKTVGALIAVATRSPIHPVPPFIESLRDMWPDSVFSLGCKPGIDPQLAWSYVALRQRPAEDCDTKPRPVNEDNGSTRSDIFAEE